jgi:ADP-heptose:LPS heptosyltransferase
LLLLTPVIRHLRLQNPGALVSVVCHPVYAPILHGVCDTLSYPSRYTDPDRDEARYDLDDTLEAVADDKVPLINRYAGKFGIKKLSHRKLDYIITPEEAAEAEERFPRTPGKVRLGVQVRTDVPNRNYPNKELLTALAKLVKKGIVHEIFLFGTPGSIRPGWSEVPEITDLTNPGLAIRQSIAAAKTCDALLVPDSIFMHIAGALNIPALVLSAAFDPSVTQAEQTTVQAMKSMATCRFCSWIPNGITSFPPDRQCVAENRCIALAGLSPDLVAHNVAKILEGKTI